MGGLEVGHESVGMRIESGVRGDDVSCPQMNTMKHKWGKLVGNAHVMGK